MSAGVYDMLRRDVLAFHDRQADALADLILHLGDGQAALANAAVVEARLPALFSSAEQLQEADAALVMDERGHRAGAGRAGAVRHLRLQGISRRTLDALLRWAYGEAVPHVGDEEPEVYMETASSTLPLLAAFDVLEACNVYEMERFSALLREAVLEALDVNRFAVVLRESHVRHIPGLKQGCMRFALHHYDELIERPEVFMGALQELPEVVSDLFRLGRRWKDEVADCRQQGDRGGSPRPAPAPPSTFVSDLGRLFQAARLAEEREKADGEAGCDDEEGAAEGPGARCSGPSWFHADLAPDCRIAVGEDIYLGHSAVLAARSDFFLAAFASDMVERASLLVTLQHVRGEAPRRDSVLALLYFLYTGMTTRVNTGNAMEVLALVGGEQSEGFQGGDCGGYLQLHDAATLRRACEQAAEESAADDGAFLTLLVQAHALGASRLKTRAMRLTVHHFKDLSLKGAFEGLPPPLLSEVLRAVAMEYDSSLPSAAKGLRWELSMLPAPDGRLENTYEAVSSSDLSCGAGAWGAAGCSEASLVATFDRQVRVRRVRIGVDLTIGDFDGSRLNGSKLQYLTSSGSWQDTGVSVSLRDGVVHEVELPHAVVAKAFRLVRRQQLAVGLLVFE